MVLTVTDPTAKLCSVRLTPGSTVRLVALLHFSLARLLTLFANETCELLLVHIVTWRCWRTSNNAI